MRARAIKPGFCLNEQLAECSPFARLTFIGLWMVADREGRLEYRPKRLRAEILPYDAVDMVALLAELETNELIVRYAVDGKEYLWIPTFLKHQNPHQNERPSELPPCPNEAICGRLSTLAESGRSEAESGRSNGEPNPADSLSPSSLIPDKEELTASADAAAVHSSTSIEPPGEEQPQGEAACGNEGQPEAVEPQITSTGKKKKRGKGKPPDEPYYETSKGFYLTGKRLSSFEAFWRAFDYRRGKAEAAEAWRNIPTLTDALVAKICAAAREEAALRPSLEQKGNTPKWAQGWLNSRRWEDYEPEKPAQGKAQKTMAEAASVTSIPEDEWRKAQETRKRLEAQRQGSHFRAKIDVIELLGQKAVNE